jgi:hypothetical protein
MDLVRANLRPLIDGALRMPPGRLRETLLADLIWVGIDYLPGPEEPRPLMRFDRPAPGWPSTYGMLRCEQCGAELVGLLMGEDCPCCAEREGRR